MATRLERYRMKDGVTPLSEDYFNPVFADLDARLDVLEQRRVDFDQAVRDLTAFGLQRIDVLIGPSFDEMASRMASLEARRVALDEAIASVKNPLAVVAEDLRAEQAEQVAAITAQLSEQNKAVEQKLALLSVLAYAGL